MMTTTAYPMYHKQLTKSTTKDYTSTAVQTTPTKSTPLSPRTTYSSSSLALNSVKYSSNTKLTNPAVFITSAF